MDETKNSKNAIEDYLNELLLDDCEIKELDSANLDQTSETKLKRDSNLTASDDEFFDLEFTLTDLDKPETKTEESNLENEATQILNAKPFFDDNSKFAKEDKFEFSESTSFSKNSDSFANRTSYEDEYAKKEIEAEAEKTEKTATFEFDATELKRKTQPLENFAQKTYDEPISTNIIAQKIIMPKLKLASGEEIIAKRSEDREAKLNPSDFSAPPPPSNWNNGRPEWGQNRFDCLLFKVMGLTLAVPLVELGGILRIEEAPRPLFGQPDWFLGLMRANDENVYLVDTAKWVLPPSLLQDADQEAYEFVIKIHNSSWGLCCNKVAEAISLEPDQVKWRGAGSKRPWLAGTVIKEMCALLDIAAFAQLLQSGHNGIEPFKV